MKDIFLLDMDDTLLDFQRAEEAGVLLTLQNAGLRADRAVAKRFHEINDALWKALERGEIAREQIMTRRWETLYEEYGFAGDPNAAAQFFFEALASFCFPFEGMEEFLKRLKSAGRVYIVTNGSVYIQRRHLKEGGIEPYCDGVFISDEIGYNKPTEEFCAYVREHVPAFSPSRAVYLGDSLTADRVCAARLGVQFVRYLPRDTQGEGIKSYSEFFNVVGLRGNL